MTIKVQKPEKNDKMYVQSSWILKVKQLQPEILGIISWSVSHDILKQMVNVNHAKSLSYRSKYLRKKNYQR